TYNESLVINQNGTSENPIILEGGEGVVLDGHTEITAQWNLDGDALYYVSCSEYPSSIDTGSIGQTENRKRLYEYCASSYDVSDLDLDDLRNRAAEAEDLSVSWCPHYSILGGWYYDTVNSKLYVRAEGDNNLNNLSVWVGTPDTAITINGNYVIVEGFEIKYYKKAITASQKRFSIIRGNDIFRCQEGIYFLLLNNISGEDLTELPNWSEVGTAGSEYGHYAGCLNEGTIIEYNTVTDPDTYAWGYGRGKTKPTIETTGVQISGPGSIVRYNYVIGYFKGISASWDVSQTNRDLNRNLDMYNNVVCESTSDSFEPEGNLINVRIWGNKCRDMWTGVSIAPVRYGPMYVWKNIFIDHGLTAFKLSSSTTGYTYIYNNTVKTDVSGIPGWRNSGYWSNVIWKNNIVISQWLLMEEDVGSADNGLELDYNLYYTPYNPGGNILQLRRKSFASIGALYNWFANDPNAYFTKELEKNSLFGNVQFVSTWPNDDFPISDMYKPVAGSLSVDSGTIIPNFSIGFEGSAPDIGTVESGALTITNSTQFLAVINSSFNQNLTATGGLFPYSWAIVSGNLSPGLNLDSATGEIYGIPTVGGQCNFVVEVQDSNLNSYNKEFSILVVSYGEEFLAEGGGCFIATAAFGTKMAKEVRILCKFRDKYLLTNFTGKIFVAFYYKYSPFIATYIAKRNSIKGNIRVLLNPLINLSEFLCEK
ncbi:MAG: hypothetical protein KAT05_05475, partial [Spirochaetes bacterium]|nr:hypothetical protein [Spirochaetota bacterium]